MTQVSYHLPKSDQTLSSYKEVENCLQKWCWATSDHNRGIETSRGYVRRGESLYHREWRQLTLSGYDDGKIQRLILNLFDEKNQPSKQLWIKEATGKNTYRERKDGETFELCINCVAADDEKYELKIKVETSDKTLNAQVIELSKFNWEDKRVPVI